MRWATPLMLATSLHAAVLGSALRWHQAGGSQPDPAAGAATAAAAPSRAVLRLVTAQQAPAPMGQDEAAPPAVQPTVEPAVESATEPATESATEPMPEPPHDDAAPAPDAAAPVPLQTATRADAESTAPAPEVYHPRSALSLAPRLQGIVDIAFPPEEPQHVRHEATLAIYIDEHGHVRKVNTVEGELPAVFVQAARNAFLGARFQPGEQHGVAVKSFIHVAVVFEARPAELLAASRALPTH